MKRRNLESIEFTASLSIRYSGASIARQVGELGVSLPDSVIGLIWQSLIVFAFLASLMTMLYDWIFIGWTDDLRLMSQAVNLLFTRQSYGMAT